MKKRIDGKGGRISKKTSVKSLYQKMYQRCILYVAIMIQRKLNVTEKCVKLRPRSAVN